MDLNRCPTQTPLTWGSLVRVIDFSKNDEVVDHNQVSKSTIDNYYTPSVFCQIFKKELDTE